ncbi:MAG: radical SAM protein [Nitrosomonas sp.]|uniref:radical SAM protein n=1 Tax=Nitrosomonas sp. TaxID=42353 RepID=UPI0025E5EC76|nr:radical SAM protein [Nitrosomonas sp.]MBY0473993.1 radical SAM protein [Nitrosomonas sp.]
MNLGILLWNTCNAACSHCAVNSGPSEKSVMTDDQIFELIDGAFYDCSRPKIGLSGGEAFAFFDRLCKICRYAINKGAIVSVNTNGFWGTSAEEAKKKVQIIKSIGVSRLVVSIDEFHQEYIDVARPLNVIRACRSEHLEVEVQFVATKATSRLADFLAKHGDDLLNIRCREIPCHPVGRAAEKIDAGHLFTSNEIPTGKCPSLILSASAEGNIIPCCNAAGHLPSLQLGTVADDISDIHRKFVESPLSYVMVTQGPQAFIPAAEKAGFKHRDGGYIDQCHLCYEIFKNPIYALKSKKMAREIYEKEFSEKLLSEFNEAMESVNG